MERDLQADIADLQKRVDRSEQTVAELLAATRREGLHGEERVELFRALGNQSVAHAQYATALSQLVPLCHFQQHQRLGPPHTAPATPRSSQRLLRSYPPPSNEVGRPHGRKMWPASATPWTGLDESTTGGVGPHRSPYGAVPSQHRMDSTLAADVAVDAKAHRIKMYADTVFLPADGDRHDPQLRADITAALAPLVEAGEVWYATQWAVRDGQLGVEVAFKVLPDAAPSLCEALIALGATSVETRGAPDPAMWHGKRYVSHELLLRAPVRHEAKSPPEFDSWDMTTSGLSNG